MLRRVPRVLRPVWHPELLKPFPPEKAWLPVHYKVKGISVDRIVKDAAAYVKRHDHMLILGTPDCGKTSMARRLAELAPKLGFGSATYYEGNDDQFANDFRTDANAQIKRQKENIRTPSRLYVVDEAHLALQTIPNFEAAYLKNRPLPIVLVGTSVATTSTATPQLLRNHKFWFFGPTVDRDLVAAYAKRVLKACNASFNDMQLDPFVYSLFDTCAGHIGIMMHALQFAVDKGSLPGLADLTQEPKDGVAAYTSRVVVGSNGAVEMKWSGERRDICADILAVGTHTAPWSEASETKKALFRRGFFAPPRNLEVAQSPLMHLGTPLTVEMTWAHPHQRRYAEKSQRIAAAPYVVKEAAVPKEPFDLLIGAAAALDVDTTVANRLTNHLSASGTASQETHLERGFTEAFKLMFPNSGLFIPQTHSTDRSKEAVDLAIRLVGSGTVEWSIEYTLNGSNIGKHLDYFAPGGIYAKMNLSQWLVVDLCTRPPRGSLTKHLRTERNYARVSPHPVVGWGAVVVERGTLRYIIPRDGVRRFINAEGRVEVATELLPPLATSNVLVTDGKVTFAVKPEQPQVMYLKAAIKEKKPNALKEIDADQLIVKDPATGNVLGDKDPLHAGVEYLYELPSAK